MKISTHINFCILLGLFGIYSCYRKPIYTVSTENNKEYEVSYLFEHEGCKVYRFFDGQNPVYFTNCDGNVTYKSDSLRTIQNTTSRKTRKK
ncbi:MAG: DUF4884 domain-containing protein [Saprospiraceae bacterium]|nr:DUF4884 domain-containing protein [Saprospiraceae bacterium]